MYTDEDLQNLSPEDKNKQKRSIQMQVIMLESDNRKLLNQKVLLEDQLRELKIKQERARIETEEKKKVFEKISAQIAQNEEELKKIKKKMNLL